MKKIFTYLGLLSITGLMNSCTDTNSLWVTEFVWKNQSDHQIMLSAYTEYVFSDGRANKFFWFQDEVIESNGVFIHQKSDESLLTPWSAFESIIVVFEDGSEATYSYLENRKNNSFSEGYDQRYDVTYDDNYQLEELDGANPGRVVVRYTYTFTNADYEAAKKLSEGNEDM